MNAQNCSSFYLGFDLSTQSIKATIIATDHRILFNQTWKYVEYCPHYNTENGVIFDDPDLVVDKNLHGDKKTVTTPSLMLIEALELAFESLPRELKAGIIGISVSAQQHASVWLNEKFEKLLEKLEGQKKISKQIQDCFTLVNGPIWMDSSTTEQCNNMIKQLSIENFVEKCGCKPFQRFTLPQINKIRKYRPDVYKQTKRIALVSNFITSILVGKLTRIDRSDGAGMNAMDYKNGEWIKELVDEELASKLGETTVAANSIVGNISSYLACKYGIPASCQVVAGSGDNPNSLVGMHLTDVGDVGISLGTSDTLFGVASIMRCKPNQNYGFITPHPTDSRLAMIMNVYSNGSLTREQLKNSFTASSGWDSFDEIIKQQHDTSLSRNDKNLIVITWLNSEITPVVTRGLGIYVYAVNFHSISTPKLVFYTTSLSKLRSLADEHGINSDELAHALIESQMLRLRVHATNLGLHNFKRIVVTGGGSVNLRILQIISDVFQSDVFALQRCNAHGKLPLPLDAASYGAALRAKISIAQHFSSHQSLITPSFPPGDPVTLEFICHAHATFSDRYNRLIPLYIECERISQKPL